MPEVDMEIKYCPFNQGECQPNCIFNDKMGDAFPNCFIATSLYKLSYFLKD